MIISYSSCVILINEKPSQELYPTQLRGIGVGAASAAGNFGGVLGFYHFLKVFEEHCSIALLKLSFFINETYLFISTSYKCFIRCSILVAVHYFWIFRSITNYDDIFLARNVRSTDVDNNRPSGKILRKKRNEKIIFSESRKSNCTLALLWI